MPGAHVGIQRRPKAVRWNDLLACTLTATPVRLHVSAEERVHSRLVTAPLGTEPLNDIRIHTERQQGFGRWRRQASSYDSAGEHLRRPRRGVVINDNVRVFQRRYAFEITC